jgi:hypothetical protein
MARGNSENRGRILALKAVLKPQLRIVAQAAVSTSDKRVGAPQRLRRIAAKLEVSVNLVSKPTSGQPLPCFAAHFDVYRRFSSF